MPENTSAITLTKIPIPPVAGKTVSIDIMEIDQDAHFLYVADRTDNGVDVFDVSTTTAKFVKTIDTGAGPNGVSVAKNVNKLFAGLNDSTIAIIDLTPGAKLHTLITKVSTGGKGRADEMDYDPKEKKLYVANSDDGFVTVIDATTNAIVKKIENLGPALEQPRYDSADGMIYMTSPDQNAIFQFDPTKDALVKKFDVGTRCGPQGLAINPKTQQALLGCNTGRIGTANTALTVSWDIAAGKVITIFDQIGAGDSTIYDPKADRFFFGAHNFNRGSMIAIFTGSPTIKFVTNVRTGDFAGSKNLAYDETNNLLYTQDSLPNEGALFSFTPPK